MTAWPTPIVPPRTCSICQATSAEAHFYAGIRGRCAECWRAEMRAKRSGALDAIRLPPPQQEAPP